MKKILMYCTQICPHCHSAEALILEKENVVLEKLRVDIDAKLKDEMIIKTGRHTVPQIFIEDLHVGGCDDLYKLEEQGELDKMLL